jgi:hypothetical protein
MKYWRHQFPEKVVITKVFSEYEPRAEKTSARIDLPNLRNIRKVYIEKGISGGYFNEIKIPNQNYSFCRRLSGCLIF